MRVFSVYFSIGLIGIPLAGCATTQLSPTPVARPAISAVPEPIIVPAGYSPTNTMNEEEAPAPMELDAEIVPAPDRNPQPIGLPDLIGLTLERNPRLGQLEWAVETARGRAVQAGLYPNPTASRGRGQPGAHPLAWRDVAVR